MAAVLTLAAVCGAADLGVPRLSSDSFDSELLLKDRVLTIDFAKYSPSGLLLEPLMGVGYGMHRFDQTGGLETVLYKVHAQAGARLNLINSIYLSAAAKLPVYSYGFSDSRMPMPSSASFSRHEYDFLRMQGSHLTWTGEIGIRLSRTTDLTIYYDQGLLNAPYSSSLPNQPEERFGTRLNFRFK